MAKTQKRLYGPATLTNTTATKYTTPAATKAKIRHIHVSNPTGGAVTFTCGIGADAAGTRIFDAYSIAAGAVLDHFCDYTLDATEIFVAHASANASLVITVNGEELTVG